MIWASDLLEDRESTEGEWCQENVEESLGEGALKESEVFEDWFLANHGPVEEETKEEVVYCQDYLVQAIWLLGIMEQNNENTLSDHGGSYN